MLVWPSCSLTWGWAVKENIFNSRWYKTDVKNQKLYHCSSEFKVRVVFLSLSLYAAGIACETANFNGSIDSRK